jgi:Tfp pilus assembly protein PilO
MAAKVNLASREQRLVLLVILCALIVVWAYATLLSAMARRTGALHREVKASHERIRLLGAIVANEAALQAQHQQVEQSVAEQRKLLPHEAELPAVISLLTDLASQSQVKIQTIFPQRASLAQTLSAGGSASPAEETGKYYRETLIQIDALAGFHQLGTFLSLVESANKPMQLVSLRITSNPKESKRHQVKMLIRAYFATGNGKPS